MGKLCRNPRLWAWVALSKINRIYKIRILSDNNNLWKMENLKYQKMMNQMTKTVVSNLYQLMHRKKKLHRKINRMKRQKRLRRERLKGHRVGGNIHEKFLRSSIYCVVAREKLPLNLKSIKSKFF